MRIVETLLRVLLLGAGLMAAPAFAFDGSKADGAMAAAPPMTAMEAFRSGAHQLKSGEKVKALHSLEYAAENGHATVGERHGFMVEGADGALSHGD